jgi:hypothetical protein
MRRSVIVVSAALLSAGLLTGCSNHPAGRPEVVGIRPPALRILSPRDHARLPLPAAVHYQFDGLPAGATLRVYYGSVPVSEHRDYPLASADGTITLPDDKVLHAVHTLTFCLVDGDQVLATTCQIRRNLLLTRGE